MSISKGTLKNGPTFLYIGADKSGSSWLHYVLEQHPHCFVPRCKDVYYFDDHYDRGPSWYAKFFPKSPNKYKAIGELSHSYLFSAQASARIANDFPDIKILAALRNPVDRCFSHYLYLKSGGLVSGSFREAIESRPGIIKGSLYANCVENYLNTFPRPQLMFYLFDQLQSDPKSLALKIYEHLGIPEHEGIDVQSRVRAARKARNIVLATAVKKGAVAARRIGLTKTVGYIKNGPLAQLLYKPYKVEERPHLSEEDRRALIPVFAEDIDRVANLLDLDLTHWFHGSQRNDDISDEAKYRVNA